MRTIFTVLGDIILAIINIALVCFTILLVSVSIGLGVVGIGDLTGWYGAAATGTWDLVTLGLLISLLAAGVSAVAGIGYRVTTGLR